MNHSLAESLILIVAAPRSGTKMLRECLRLHPDVVGLTYELERVWCLGHPERINMPLGEEAWTPAVQEKIRDFFHDQVRQAQGKRLVVKSTLLPLRVRFFRRILPEVPVVHIVRDGRDAAISIRDRHVEPLEWRYMLKKRIFPPLAELPYYLKQLLSSRVEKTRQGHVKTWGPRFDDSDSLRQRFSLLVTCGITWNRSVMGMWQNQDALRQGPFHQLHYEKVATDPEVALGDLAQFLGLRWDDAIRQQVCGNVSGGRASRWLTELSPEELAELLPHVQEGLACYGYLEGGASGRD